jgi:hypothetical protein
MKLTCLCKKLIYDAKDPIVMVGILFLFVAVWHIVAYSLAYFFPIIPTDCAQLYLVITGLLMLLALFASWFYTWITGAIDYCRRIHD